VLAVLSVLKCMHLFITECKLRNPEFDFYGFVVLIILPHFLTIEIFIAGFICTFNDMCC